MFPSQSIDRREWRWALAVALAALLVSSIPLLAGYLAQTDELRFAGAVYDISDYFSHLAKIQLGARGEFRYRSLFTPEPHASEPVIYNDILLGAIAAPLGIRPAAIYELSRLLGGLVMLLTVYKFIASFLPDLSTRRLAFLIAIVSSGLGWLFLTHPAFTYPNISPIEFWLADGYLLFSIMAFPHFGWSIAALLAAFMAWRAYADQPGPRRLFWFLAFSTLLGLIQIFELALLDAVIGLDALGRFIRSRSVKTGAVFKTAPVWALQLLMLWPYLYAIQTNPLFQVWSQQSRTLSPAPHYYLIGYGLLWPLVIMGLAWAWRQRKAQLLFPALWLGAAAALVYSPNGIQYRWLEGAPVALAIFAAIGLESVAVPFIVSHLPLRRQPPRLWWWATALIVVAMMPSTLYLVAGNTLLAATHWKEAFFTRGQVEAMEWLAANSQPDDTVLADLKLGNAIPGWIGHRAFYGHWAETMFYAQKGQQVAAFFSTLPDADRQALLRDYGVRYVIHGPDERKLGNFVPGRAPYLQLQYQNEDTAVYEVVSSW